MGCFFALQRAVAPCLNGYLFPTALFASRLNCRSRGGVEICLVSKRMFIPDGTPVLVTEYYILTRRKQEVLNMVACSATSVESCLCLKARKVWQRGRLRRWGRRRRAIAIFWIILAIRRPCLFERTRIELMYLNYIAFLSEPNVYELYYHSHPFRESHH